MASSAKSRTTSSSGFTLSANLRIARGSDRRGRATRGEGTSTRDAVAKRCRGCAEKSEHGGGSEGQEKNILPERKPRGPSLFSEVRSSGVQDSVCRLAGTTFYGTFQPVQQQYELPMRTGLLEFLAKSRCHPEHRLEAGATKNQLPTSERQTPPRFFTPPPAPLASFP